MASPHSSAMSAAIPVYETVFPFFTLQLSEGPWCGGSGDETRLEYGMELLLYTVTSNLCSELPTMTLGLLVLSGRGYPAS